MNEVNPPRKFRILCLHGYRQDGNALRAKMGGLRKSFNSLCEFYFVDAPHIIPLTESESNEGPNNNQRSWYFNIGETQFNAYSDGEPYGFNESIKYLEDYIKDKPQFDALLGFSQGGTMAHMFLNYCNANNIGFFSGIINNAGFESKCHSHREYFSEQFDGASLVIYSENDQIIRAEDTKKFLDYYIDGIVIKHEGGHGFPSVSVIRPNFIYFLKRLKAEIDTNSIWD